MKKLLFVVLALAAGAAGCDSDSYSPAIRYPVRTDPLVLDKNLADERVDPVRPGVFPIFAAKDLNDPFNPLHAKRATLFKEKKLRDPNLLSKKDRHDLEVILVQLFGTPARPVVRVDTDIKETLKLDDESLVEGSALYRVHCLHCHGVPGDGRGPTSRWVNPHPRDYRQGLFKFMSVDQTTGAKPPRRDDLKRVIHQGVEGTAMPPFALLRDVDVERLVSYVTHLSIRGKVEFDTIRNAFDYDAEKNTLTLSAESLDEAVDGYLKLTAKAWADSQKNDKAISVAPYPFDDNNLDQIKVSVQRGFQLFKGEGSEKLGITKEEAKAANCVSCHKDFGRQAMFKFDDWGTLTKPRDLTQGVYRGGRRPVDVYYRIHSGIQPSGMTSFGNVLPNPERIWDLVNFVKTMPYPAMRKKFDVVLD